MKKKVSVGILLVFGLYLLMTGCGDKKRNGKLILEDGVLSWKKAADASWYEVDMGSGGIRTEDTQYDLAANCELESCFTVSVRKVSEDGEKSKIGSLEIETKKLEAPIVSVEDKDGELYFVWKEVEGASTYTYDVHDGTGERESEADEDGRYSVPVEDSAKQMIRVTAKGGSEGNKVYLSNDTIYLYEGDTMFDPALMAKYPAVYVSKGLWVDSYEIGTTLSKGVYDVTVSFYMMDADGRTVTGNGLWGRRITDGAGTNFWFCETDVENFESADTIPSANTMVTRDMNVTVDKYGNLFLHVYDYNVDEQIVFADVVYNGKSVLNSEGGIANASKEVAKFDLTKADSYLKTWTSAGTWYTDDPAGNTIELPVELSDGIHPVEVSYYVCDKEGDVITGNGMWGRRFAVGYEDAASYVWLNEFDIENAHNGIDLPEPTKLQTATFTVDVKNGKFKILALDFNQGEKVIISKVAAVQIPSGNGVFVSEGSGVEELSVTTTLAGDTRLSNVILEVTYTVSDIFGQSIAGNGIWGRRIMDASGEESWLCETAVEGHDDSAKTLPKAEKTVTTKMQVAEINKKGIFTLKMHDFKALEMVKITSVKYNGKEVLKK